MRGSVIAVLCAIICICAAQECKVKRPVVLLPGIMGTIIQGSADIPPGTILPDSCPHQFEDQLMWIDLNELIHYKCLKDYFSSNFNPDTGKWERFPGMTFTTPKWGTTYAIYDLAPNGLAHGLFAYYRHMIDKFTSLGYVDGFNILGAGFDWKELPSDKFVNDLKELVEKAYTENNNTKVALVAHSMGGPVCHYFLCKVEKENKGWIEKYIHMFIPMAPAWMGAVRAFDFMLMGADEDLPIAGKYFAPLMRHLPGLWFLLPNKDAFPNTVLASTPSKTYLYDDMVQLFKDGNLSYVEEKLHASQQFYRDMVDNYDSLPYSNLTVREFLGRGKKTVIGLKFHEDIKPHDPDGAWESCSRIMGDGDETVPFQSAMYAAEKWMKAGYDVQTFTYDKMTHMGLVQDAEIIQKVVDFVCSN